MNAIKKAVLSREHVIYEGEFDFLRMQMWKLNMLLIVSAEELEDDGFFC